jgi:hypothetical protein
MARCSLALWHEHSRVARDLAPKAAERAEVKRHHHLAALVAALCLRPLNPARICRATAHDVRGDSQAAFQIVESPTGSIRVLIVAATGRAGEPPNSNPHPRPRSAVATGNTMARKWNVAARRPGGTGRELRPAVHKLANRIGEAKIGVCWLTGGGGRLLVLRCRTTTATTKAPRREQNERDESRQILHRWIRRPWRLHGSREEPSPTTPPSPRARRTRWLRRSASCGDPTGGDPSLRPDSLPSGP